MSIQVRIIGTDDERFPLDAVFTSVLAAEPEGIDIRVRIVEGVIIDNTPPPNDS